MSKLDRKLFFDAVRPSIFGGALSQLQVKGTEAVLDSCERYGIKRLEWTAYVLANTHHETAGTMQPIREYGGDSWLTQMYDIRGARPDKAKELGNINPGDGVRYAGGGFTMLTGRNNYKKQGDKHNVDLVNDPELVLIDYDLSADIMVSGMLDGDFTGKKLADYDLPDGGFDALGARRIVNGYQKPKIVNGVEIDKPHARLIVATYELFLNALTVSYSRDKAVEAGPSSPAGTVGTSSPVGPHIPVDQDGGIDWGVVERGMGEAIKSGENVGFDFAQVSAGKATAPNVKIKQLEDMDNYYVEERDGPITYPDTDQQVDKAGNKMQGLLGWFDGKKTHLGMMLTGAIGVASMFGLVSGITPEAGADMLQSSLAIIGGRSAAPKLILMAVQMYVKSKQG